MDRASFADPIVVRLSNERFVPLRVDAERRPDVGDRYGLGGWPTIVVLASSGEVLTGGTFVTSERLREMLPQVVEAYGSRLGALEQASDREQGVAAGPSSAIDEIDETATDWAARRLADEFDEEFGGFGTAPKMPHTDALLFAIELGRQRDDPTLRRIADTSLDAMHGGLLDAAEGGFFRYCAGRDWTAPGTEKLLETNAALLRVYVSAWRAWAHDRDRDAAAATLRYVANTLSDRADGGFYASQRACEPYYALDSRDERRAGAPPPPVDRTLFTGANASMVRAWLDAAEAFGDTALGEFAVQSLERVLLATYRRGAGVTHWTDDGTEVPLLGDQTGMAAALVDAFRATERPAYLDLAQELMLTAMRRLSDEKGAAFLDRPLGSTGRLREPLRPLGFNCEAAMVLIQLAALTRETAFRDRAAAVLAAFGERYRAYGLQGVCYARALQALHA